MSVVPFSNTPPVTGQVVFDPVAFVASFPDFTNTAQPVLQSCFDRAVLQLDNGPNSRVQDANLRETLLNLLTAHICFLNYGTAPATGSPVSPPGVVGHISSATEGSVSVSAEVGPKEGSRSWFMQSKWGIEYWEATAGYRNMQYVPGSSGPFYPPGFGINGSAGFWPNGSF